MKSRSPLLLIACTLGILTSATRAEDVPAVLSGGHDIGRNDHGRPCILIAAALGVETGVFREAFRGVTPAKGRGPTGGEARKNKSALLRVLGPKGVTNERLDEVSDYYRFRPQNGELWKHREAKAHAVVEGGKLARVVIDDPGAGYSSPPKVKVRGFERAEFVVELELGKDLETNGAVRSIKLRDK